MSDVPATFFSTLLLLLLLTLRPSTRADLFLGSSLGLAVWIRPNTFLLFLPVLVWFMVRREWIRIFRVGLTVSIFLTINGLVNSYLYGSLMMTGYGKIPIGDSFCNTIDRGIRHLLRLHNQQAELGLFLVLWGFLFGRLSLAIRFLLAGIFAVFLIFFSGYRWDDAWWYFRFLLPALPAIAVLEASFLVRLLSIDKWKRWSHVFSTAILVIYSWASINIAREYSVFNNRYSETKYPKAASMVIHHIKSPALIMAMLYSGPLRFYGKLPTTRYDLTSGQELLESIRAVNKAGGNVYLVLEKWELEKLIKTDSAILLNFMREIDSFDNPTKVWLFELNVPLE